MLLIDKMANFIYKTDIPYFFFILSPAGIRWSIPTD